VEEEVLWVAEIGSLHKGEKDLAHRMIIDAKIAGADIAKFQLGHDPEDPIRYIDDWAHELARRCENTGIEFMASLWNIRALKIARDVGMKRYKIAHQIALSNNPVHSKLVDAILSDGKETFISAPPPRMGRMRLKHARWLYCQGEYPLYPEDLLMPAGFKKQGYFGYSSHMAGVADAYLAIARGSRLIEKHVCLDRQMVTRDAAFALRFPEFRQMKHTGDMIAGLI